MTALQALEFIKAIKLLKFRKRGYDAMSKKVKKLLVENMEQIGNGKRPIKTASEVNKAGHHHSMESFAEAKLHDRGVHSSQLAENKDLIERL